MSRHRNIRKMRLEDEMDEEEDVDYSEEDEEPVSPESAQFLYQRPGQAQKSSASDAIAQERDENYGEKAAQSNKQQTPKPTKEKAPIQQPSMQNLRLTNANKTRTDSKSPSRVKGSPTKSAPISNLQLALNTAPTYKKRVRPSDTAQSVHLIIAGHVDAGKSTLVGHLLYLLGDVEERTMQKHRQEASRMGKASFAFAWILDESEEERTRGVTMDVARVNFTSPSGRNFIVLDAPGHKDFIPNMITGASQADAALLVVNATRGEFETGFDQGGQTREHCMLLRALGVSRLVVAVNKLDTVDWSQERYDHLCAVLAAFHRRAGFESATFVPVSGLLGINLVQTPPDGHPLGTWYRGPTLIDTLDAFPLSAQPEDGSWLRIVVNDVLRQTPTTLAVSAKVVSGHVENGHKLWLMPEANPVTVKAIATQDTTKAQQHSNEQVFFAGDQITLTLAGSFEPDTVFPGHMLCRGGEELVVPSRRFRAKIVTFDTRMTILRGTQAELFVHSLRVPCVISRLLAIHSGQKDMERRNPRLLPPNVAGALVDIRTELPISLEPFSKTKSLGRLALRAQGETIAAGIVEECFFD